MKTFKSVEELLKFVCDESNIETLENGEVTLKDWYELGNSLESHKKTYDLTVKEKKTLKGKNDELTKQVAELTGQLESATTELTGLKEVHGSGDKEALQKLNKENSALKSQNNLLVSEIREKDKQLAGVPELEKKFADLQVASNRSIILDAVKKAMAQRKVPQHIIDDTDITRFVVDAFSIDDAGHIFSKEDMPQSVENYIAAKQKEKPHWSAVTVTAGDEVTRAIGGGGFMADEQAAIMAALPQC